MQAKHKSGLSQDRMEPQSWLVRLKNALGDVENVLFLLWTASGIGLVCLLLPAISKVLQSGWSAALIVLATGLFLAGGSTLAGSMAGFLFGVPRHHGVMQPDEEQPTYHPNTNLEQISDWLTKIFVGIGLTQIPTIIDFFDTLGSYAGPALAASPAGEVIAIAIVLHYLAVGFFQGFLLAYLWLPGAFARANRNSEGDQCVPTADDSGKSVNAGHI